MSTEIIASGPMPNRRPCGGTEVSAAQGRWPVSQIGAGKGPGRIRVRGYWHFTECVVAMWPKMFPDVECRCMDWSP